MRSPVPILPVIRPNAGQRLSGKLVTDGECLVFTGMRNARGYGFVPVMVAGKRYPILAHRLAWALENGEPPADRIVCHRCNNPSCCNVKHLYLGTPQDSADDMVRAGRSTKNKKVGLYGVRGVNHPRSTYGQEVRDRVVAMRRDATPYEKIRQETGVPFQTISRWWKEHLDGKSKTT